MLNHKYCGSTFPHHLESTSNNIEIQFQSDSSGTGSGFRLHYSLANCNTTFTTKSGLIYGSEKDGGNCFTTIKAQSGHFVTLYILWMYFLGRTSEPTMKIYDGESASSPLLREFRGYVSSRNPIYSTGNSLHIEVRNPPPTYRYRLSYATSEFRNGCGGKFYGKENVVASPNFPGTPTGNMTCEYLVAVPHNFHAALRYMCMDI
ncbi:Cubilin-like protein [Armadillidium vulgare]|nr:Cubilin-like protein [Armadillidium vulgare]